LKYAVAEKQRLKRQEKKRKANEDRLRQDQTDLFSSVSPNCRRAVTTTLIKF
jgi:hypothetical protein